jgi:outer membrane protein assembly factor BamB
VLLPLLILAVIAAGCAKVAGSRGWAQPQLTDNVLYVTLQKGQLTAIDEGTYNKIWTFPPSGGTFACGSGASQKYTIDGIYGEPAVDASNVYFASYDGAVYAVKRSDGTCAWRMATGDAILAAPILSPSGLNVASTDGYLYLLDPATGAQKDRFNYGEAWATPLLTKDALYLATMAGQLWKLDPATLKPVWPAPFKVSGGLMTPPALAGDNTVIVGGISGLYAVDTTSGQQKWSASGKNWFWGPPAVDGTAVYVTDLAGEVKALDGTTGKSLWSADFVAKSGIRSGAVLAGGVLVVTDNGGEVYRIDPKTGKEIGDQPNLLNEDVLATALVVEGAAAPSSSATPSPPASASTTATPSPTASASVSATVPASPSPSPSSGSGVTVYIVTESGHLFTLDPAAGRTVEVISQ